MGKPYSDDLRERVVAAIEAGQTRVQVANLYNMALSTVGGFIKRKRETGRVSPDKFGGYKTFALEPHTTLTRLRLRPTRCIGWRGWCKWTPVEPAGTCPGYKSSKLDGSEDPWTTGARDEHTAIGGGSLA